MRLRAISFLLTLALVSFVVVLPFRPDGRTAGFFRFEVTLLSDAPGTAQVYWDDGSGFAETNSARQSVEPGGAATLTFLLPATRLTALRFDPLDTAGRVTVSEPRIAMRTGQTVRAFTVDQWVAANQIETLNQEDARLRVHIAPGATDPVLLLQPFEPIDLSSVSVGWMRYGLVPASAVFAGLLGLVALVAFLRRQGNVRQRATLNAWGTRLRARPLLSVALVAAVAMLASSYPVVFFGQSFVSPNNGVALLYPGAPTLPGLASTVQAEVKQADVGAIMWQHVPNSSIQHQALGSGELPLWNRYNSAGVPLLGQGQSAFGDPLHLIPLLARGAAWAWDLRYLLAKWVLGFGAGYAVWLLTRHQPSALLLAASAPFIGFFVYRVNHPAIFSLSYAPWVLVAWLGLLGARNRRALAGWCAAALAVNGALLCSGTAKEAVVLLVGLNATGLLFLLFAPLSWRARGQRLGAMAWTGLVLVLLTAPHWMVFLDTLRLAYTTYDEARAYQLPPGLLVGLFDEIFHRPSQRDGGVINPSANGFVLVGVLWAAVRWRQAWEDRAVRALILASIVPLAFTFAVIPPRWIVAVPGLAGLMHIDNTFSCVLIVLSILLAGWGWTQALARLGTPAGRAEAVTVSLLLVLLVAIYYGTVQSYLRSSSGISSWGAQVTIDPWINGYAFSLIAAATVGLLVLHQSRARDRWTVSGVLLLALCFLALHWRHGLHCAAGNPNYVLLPGERAVFSARSPAIEHLKTATLREPARVAGIEATFFPGWSAMYRLEGISGPDALMSRHYRELMIAGGLQPYWDWRYVIEGATLPARQPLLDAINLGYVLAAPGQPFAAGDGYTLDLDADLRVYRSTSVWPRAFFVDRVTTYSDVAGLITQLERGDGRPFAALHEDEAPAATRRDATSDRIVVPATDYELTVNRTGFTLDTPAAGLAVLTESHWPRGFRARVNGRPAEIVRVNHAFKGVLIPAAGTYRVEFIHRPAVLPLALGLATAGLILGGAPLLLLRRNASLVP